MMKRAAALALLVIAVSAVGVAPRAAQDAPATQPVLSPQEMEAFLRTAKIVARKTSSRASPAGSRDAHRRAHHTRCPGAERRHLQGGLRGRPQAHRDQLQGHLSLQHRRVPARALLGLDNVPMSVPRNVDGKPAAMTWWVDDVAMDEGGRQKLKTARLGPKTRRGPASISAHRCASSTSSFRIATGTRATCCGPRTGRCG